MDITVIENEIRAALFDEAYFFPEMVGIVKFRFHRYCDDNSWYEMETIEALLKPTKRSLMPIREFIDKLISMKQHCDGF